MSLQHTIENDIKKAMLARKQDELTALRAVKSAILLAKTEKGNEGVLSEDTEMKLLTRMVKQRSESAEIFLKENRQELANKELLEIDVIKRYLPKQLSKEDVQKEVKAIIEETGATDMKDMGKVMGIATSRLAGKADGKTISEIVKALLA